MLLEDRTAFEDWAKVFHWLPEESRWELILWKDWTAFRAINEIFSPLSDVSSGVHYFVVCFHDEQQTLNLIPHKYLIELDGQIGRDNFTGWTREDRRDYWRLMMTLNPTHIENIRLAEIRYRISDSMYPPPSSVFSLQQILPGPPRPNSPAEHFIGELLVLEEQGRKKK
ncbi:MAG TPA: hypothetical protein PKB01_10250 [Xanthobacteraceae bacterium]|nr:hypothetical protein [Xanthobacteraceae bacterium]